MTLIRSVGWLSRDDLLTRKGAAGPITPTPRAQCLGVHTFKYSIFPHAGNWEKARVWRQAYQHNIPLKAVQTGRHEGYLPRRMSFLEVSPENLMISAIKKDEENEAIIVRLFNITDSNVTGRIRSWQDIAKATLVNLDEKPIGRLEVNKRKMVEVKVGKYKVVTVKLELSRVARRRCGLL